MTEDKRFVSEHGMLMRHSYHGRKDETGKLRKVEENSHLCRVINYALRRLNGEYASFLIPDISSFTDRAYYYHGYLKNHIDPLVLKHNPDLSHDQMDSHCIWSSHVKSQIHQIINRRFWFGFYNGRFFAHPRCQIFIAALAHKGWLRQFYCRLLQPIMWFTFKRSHRQLKGKTVIKNSEAHLWWLRCWALDVPWFTAKYNEYCKEAFGSVKDLFVSYYKEAEHPNLQFEKYEL